MTEYNYTVRPNKDKPVAFCRNGRILLGHDAIYDSEVCIANRPESQAVSVAVGWFRDIERKSTEVADLSRVRKAGIREAKGNGATISAISRSYNLKDSVVKRVLRGI